MKPEWERVTRVCASGDLQPDLLAAIRCYAEEHELTAVETQALVSFETVSRRMHKARLIERLSGGGHTTVTRAVIVTPTRLVWAQRGDDEAAWATSELLARLDAQDYESSPEAAILPDHGLTISGVPVGEGHSGSLFFGLGDGPAAGHARQVLKDALRAAHGEGPSPA